MRMTQIKPRSNTCIQQLQDQGQLDYDYFGHISCVGDCLKLSFFLYSRHEMTKKFGKKDFSIIFLCNLFYFERNLDPFNPLFKKLYFLCRPQHI